MSWKMTPRFKARVTRLRPLQTPPAPPSSVFKDEQCIFITPDALGEFAVKIVPSERVTMGSDKFKKGMDSMPNLPPLYARRLQTLQNRTSVKAYESAKSKRRNKRVLELDFKGDLNKKPVQHGVY
ncbi:hypothetical protein CHS0354_019025 [Potamilus streckersoni]|uniref:Uncharacterized protein n=1 Tax=Potamilus streckersoni TaxID=2493646 RepID=A0AAE0SAV0_9BIVA|nr:hypothetical protein CHS0354_019025 [Potamilus streckersoni]